LETARTLSIKLERGTRRFAGGPGVIGYLVVAAVVGFAVLLYFLHAGSNAANGGPISGRGTGFVLGEAIGIAAATLLAVTVILASRLAILEILFGDLTKVYVAHGVVGLTMFALVSLHPLMYLLGGLLFGESFLGASDVIVPFHTVVIDWIAYILIAAALVPTMYLRLPFATWRWIHLALGAALLLNGYSILIENSFFDTEAIPGLRIYLFIVFGLATAAFLWVAVFRRRVEPKREYRIVEAKPRPEAHAIELIAEPVGKPLKFQAGQFVYADLLDSMAQIEREFEAHPFSISSPPGRDRISLVIGAVGHHTTRIAEIAASDEARALLHGPFGRLVIDRPARHKQLWIAGGTGITPFLSMAGELAERPERYEGFEVDLVIAVREAGQAFWIEELESCEARFPGLRIHLWDHEDVGHPTVPGIAEIIAGDLRERAVMISGPEAMISGLTDGLLRYGVPRGQIRSERGIGPPGNWRVASPALRRVRFGVTALFATFVLAAAVGTIGNAFF
jgi:predicted ferric reductase